MATQQPQPQSAPDYRLGKDATVVSAITSALLSGSLGAIVALLAPIAKRLHVDPGTFAAAVSLTLRAQHELTLPSTPGPAYLANKDPEAALSALYLMRAAQRMQAAVDAGASISHAMAVEARFYGLHLMAQQNRRRAAAATDAMVAQTGSDLVGWQAVMDARTSAECAAANGKNYSAADPPLIGLPGAVHPHCRCRPVPAFDGAPMVGQEWSLEDMLHKSPERV